MGLEKEVLRAGTGPKPVPGQSVTVHCTGYGQNPLTFQKQDPLGEFADDLFVTLCSS